jgi:uncharacterized protein (DUF305 family)
MTRAFSRTIATVLAVTALGACSSATRTATRPDARTGVGAQSPLSPAEQARADGGKPAFSQADIDFISGMVGHHAQAVLMAGWAPSHGASPAVAALCERIVVAQRDEIAFLQRWLRDRGKPVPSGDASHDMMPGMEHPHMMPGMLTAEQLIQLDKARGPEFDRLFLGFMIQHHEGAITMVDKLLGSRGAAQDDAIYKFASDVYADQTTEIERMTKMLEAMPARPGS